MILDVGETIRRSMNTDLGYYITDVVDTCCVLSIWCLVGIGDDEVELRDKNVHLSLIVMWERFLIVEMWTKLEKLNF